MDTTIQRSSAISVSPGKNSTVFFGKVSIGEVASAIGRGREKRNSDGSVNVPCPCPTHGKQQGDRSPSFNIHEHNGYTYGTCKAECLESDIRAGLRGLGIYEREKVVRFTPRNKQQPQEERTVIDRREHVYTDKQGRKVFSFFMLKYSDGSRGSYRAPKGKESPLYRLPEVLAAAKEGKEIWITEGEKDADTANQWSKAQGLDIQATTIPNGAGAPWKAEHTEGLRGAKRILIFQDNDTPGRNAALKRALALCREFEEVRVVELPIYEPDGKDFTDWVQKGGTLEGLHRAIEAASIIKPPSTSSTAPLFTSTSLFDDTERINGQRLAHYFGNVIRVCWERQEFFYYNDGRWEQNELYIQELAKTIPERVIEESYTKDADKQEELQKWAKRSQSARSIKATIEMAKSESSLRVERATLFDSHKHLFNVKNGTIDLRTGELLKHDPKHLMTRQCPIEYNEKAECPKFERFLLDILESEQEGRFELMKWLLRYFGYCLSGEAGERLLLIFYGKGRNGKSTLLEVLSHVFGCDYSATMDIEAIAPSSDSFKGSSNYETAKLKGKRLAITSETEEGATLKTALVKNLTGNEKRTDREIYGKPFEYTPEFKVIMATNHKPVIPGDDQGIWDRSLLIPFTYRVPDAGVNPRLKDELIAEAPGILALLVKEATLYFKEGLGELPKVLKEARSEYQKESDPVQSFLNSQMEPAKGVMTELQEVADAFEEYRISIGYPKRTLANKLSKRLKELGCHVGPYGANKKSKVFNYRLKQEEREEEDATS